MFLWGFFLLPMIFAIESELKINDFIIKIDDNILMSITSTSESTELNLSNLSLRALDEKVFDNLSNLNTLNLANNNLANLPEFIFSKLKNLENLNLANNQIEHLPNVFGGLENLKSLDISNNKLRKILPIDVRGLNEKCSIFLQGNPLKYFYTDIFADPNSPTSFSKYIDSAKICIDKGSVKSLDLFKEDEILENDCKKVKIIDRIINLKKLGITKFEKGWYRLQGFRIYGIDLCDNKIARITKELLNDLPQSIVKVNLLKNKIERLEKDIIDNHYLHSLDLSSNRIRYIEDGAFSQTKLTELNLDDNKLEDTKFLSKFPSKLSSLYLGKNQISKIEPDSFSNLNRLRYLRLCDNKITEIDNNSLRGLMFLECLNMTKNGLKNIQPGSFKDLIFLENLNIEKNSIEKLEKGVFAGLSELKMLNIGKNKLKEITRENLQDLPSTLMEIQLCENEIEILEAGTFIKVPRTYLSLEGNNISKIEKGSFDLPTLIDLTLKKNRLSEFNAEIWEGLPELRRLSVEYNDIKIISKGSTRYLNRLETLELNGNPIKRFESGSLNGLLEIGSGVYIENVPIEYIQAGLFKE